MSADYTRTIVFKVEDQAIKRATDRITRSLSNIERSLKKIETKGFTGLAKGAEQASKQVLTASESIGALTQQSKALKKAGGEALNTISNRFKVVNKGITLQPFKGLVEELTRVPFVVKRSFQDFRTLFEILGKGGKDIVGLVSGIIALGNNIKNFGSTTRSNLTSVGRLLEENSKKAGNFLNTIGLAIQMQDSSVALQRNTLLARQKSLPGNLLRNTLRSRAGREGSGFADFSKAAGEYNPYRLSTSGAGRPRQFGPAGNLAGDARFVTDPVSKAIRRHEIKKQKMLKRELKIEEQILGIRGKAINMERQYQSPIGPTPLTRMEKFGFGNRASSKGMFASPGRAGGRVKGALQSGMIGGGFPLLFGQSGLASVLGGVGGAAGGALSPGFGFAGSIVATAAAQKIQEMIDFRKAVDKLNVSIRATGGTSVFTAAQVTKFAKSLGMTKDEALNALAAFQQFEASARIALTTVFGSEAIFNMAAGFKDNAYLIGQMNQLSQVTSIEQAKTALEVLKTKGLREAEVATTELLIKKQQELTREQTKKTSVGFLDKMNPFRGMFEFGAKRKNGSIGAMSVEELRQARTDKFTKEDFPRLLAEAKERLELQRQFNDQLERMAIIKAPEDELRKLLDPLRQLDSLAKSVGESFSESFKGIVNGSMTAQQALANLFQRTADHFLDMAAQIIAKQIQMKILGIGLNFLGGIGTTPSGSALKSGSFGTGVGKMTDTAASIGRHAVGGASVQPNFTPRAFGGPVSGGSPYIVGEKGPELFVPGSSGNIVPNHAMGGANIVVNVDASGSSVEGDAGQAEQLGSMLAAAVQSEIANQQRPGGLLAGTR